MIGSWSPPRIRHAAAAGRSAGAGLEHEIRNRAPHDQGVDSNRVALLIAMLENDRECN